MPTKKQQKPTKIKAGAWFIRVRGSYLPASLAGWLTYIPFIAYLVGTLIIAWQNVPSHSQAILFIVPNWIAATVVMTWVASRKS